VYPRGGGAPGPSVELQAGGQPQGGGRAELVHVRRAGARRLSSHAPERRHDLLEGVIAFRKTSFCILHIGLTWSSLNGNLG
jgi:hypothetical protein